MKGKALFSHDEAASIASLLRRIRSSPREDQKRLRETLRTKHRFYISDFTMSTAGFTAEDFDALIASGSITVKKAGEI